MWRTGEGFLLTWFGMSHVTTNFYVDDRNITEVTVEAVNDSECYNEDFVFKTILKHGEDLKRQYKDG